MSRVTLTLRARPEASLEAPEIRPDHLAGHSEREIAHLPVWHGRQRVALGEFFRVHGARSDEVHVHGELGRVRELGAGMRGGTLVIEGDAGAHTAAGMHGGRVLVTGSVGDWCAAEMRGGVVEVRGDAGAHLGGAYAGGRRGMRGGTVVVRGSAGGQAGSWMRRGLLAVAGGVGEYAGANLIAGTLLALGPVARRAGAGMRRGTIVACSGAEVLPTFRVACVYRPPVLPLLLRHLRDDLGFPVAEPLLRGRYRRYTGDYAELGKGEVLVWAGE